MTTRRRAPAVAYFWGGLGTFLRIFLEKSDASVNN